MKEIRTIAVICNYELKPDRIGGMDRFFKAYNSALIEQGKQVTWFFSGGEIFKFYEKLDLHFSDDGDVEKLFLDYIDEKPAYDLAVTHFVALCTSFYKEVKKKGVQKIIAVDHNPRPLNGFPLKKRIKNRIKGILYSDYIDRFVGVSQYTVDQILKDYGKNLSLKTVVVYNGVDTFIYLKRTDDNLGKFIVASHLRESKGIQDLVEAVYNLPLRIKKVMRIDIFGEGPLEQQLDDKIKEYELQNIIKLKGSSCKLPVLYKNYSFLLQPTYMECFSLSILESLAANVPVITTPVGGNLEIISDGINGYVFPPGNIKILTKTLENVVMKNLTIENDLSSVIEKNFNLQKMVLEHIKLL